MVRLSIASHKGGVGKTTTAIQLAGCLAALDPGKKILLIDGDRNRSALNWYERGNKDGIPFAVVSDGAVPNWMQANGFPDHIIRDTHARPDEHQLKDLGESSDVLIIPTTPAAFSLDVLQTFVSDIAKYGLGVPYAFLLTIVDPRARDGVEARAFLEGDNQPLLAAQVRAFNAYEKAAQQGVLVKDARSGGGSGKKDARAGVAWMDCMAVAEEVWEAIADV